MEWPVSMFLDHTPAANPYSLLLALFTTSSYELNLKILITGPKISSLNIFYYEKNNSLELPVNHATLYFLIFTLR